MNHWAWLQTEQVLPGQVVQIKSKTKQGVESLGTISLRDLKTPAPCDLRSPKEEAIYSDTAEEYTQIKHEVQSNYWVFNKYQNFPFKPP